MCAGAFAAPDVIHWAPGLPKVSCSAVQPHAQHNLHLSSSSCSDALQQGPRLPACSLMLGVCKCSHHAPARNDLPLLLQTRSGKIMRRVLRKIAAKEEDQLGDTSTLAGAPLLLLLLLLLQALAHR